MGSCLPQQFQLNSFMTGISTAPLASPRMSDTASLSSSASPSPLYFLDNTHRYSISEAPGTAGMSNIDPSAPSAGTLSTNGSASSGLYIYAIPPATNPNIDMDAADIQPSMLSQQVPMNEYISMEYPLHHNLQQQQHQPSLQHRHSSSSINTSASSSSSIFSSVGQPPLSSLSSTSNLTTSPLEMTSSNDTITNTSSTNNDSTKCNNNSNSINHNSAGNTMQPYVVTQQQLEYMTKMGNVNTMPPTPGERPPTPGYSFRMSDLSLDNSNTDNLKSDESTRHRIDSKRSRSSISDSSSNSSNMMVMMPIKIEQLDDDHPHSMVSEYSQLPIPPQAETIAASVSAPSGKRKRAARRRLTVNQKIAHNKIEKKYRTNINEKIFGLDDLISPSFRCDSCSSLPCDKSLSDGFEDGGTDCHQNHNHSNTGKSNRDEGRPNKSKILERAASYIKYLKGTNSKLRERNNVLKYRLVQYE